ncbi:Taste receptor cell protein 1 [Lemmus lemmus]
MSLLQPSPTHGSEKFSKVSKLSWIVPASASLEKSVVPKPTCHPVRVFTFPIFSRAPCLFQNTSSPTAWRNGHSRPGASPSVAPRSSSGLPNFPRMPNTLKATEPLLPASSGASRLGLASQALTVDSGSAENTVALATGPVSSGASVLLLSSAMSPSHPSSPYTPPSSSALPPSSSSSLTAPSTTDSSIKTSYLAPLQPSHPGPWVPPRLIHLPTLSLAPHSSGSTELSGGADATLSPTLSHPGQDVSLQDLSSFTPGPSHVIHSVTFRVNSESFTTAAWNLVALKRQMLERFICYEVRLPSAAARPTLPPLASSYRPGSTEVQASLMFGQPDPSALEILWTLYRKVKASRWLLGHLSLTDNSLSSDGYNVTDLSRETVSISFTLMRPFLPQLLLPGSQAFILLEKQILPLVTPEVSRFYKANPQDQPLLLFSNVNEWVSIYMEYKFKSPIPTHLQGLASYLAHHITDPTLQKSSMVANGEKAELALYETWLLILDHPFIKALENKTSSESQELRGLLTKWLTSVLQPLKNFGQVVVEEFQQEPLTAKVQAAFFGAAPAQAIIQDCMHQALSFLQEAEGLQFEIFIPVLGIPSSRASRGPSHGFMLNLQSITSLLVLVSLARQGLLPDKQVEPLRP